MEGDGLNSPKGASFFISFYDTQRIKNVLAAIREEPEMFCGLFVEDVVIEETPDLTRQEQFNLGSPILIKRPVNGKVVEYYYDNLECGRLLEETLRTKMRIAGIPDDDSLSIAFDLSYPKKKTKLVWYDKIGNRANMCPVIVKGNNGEFVLPFPAKGEVPFMVATNIAKAWSKERINVETLGWFGHVKNDCKIEIKK